VPIVVAQHMPTGFTAAFAERLDGVTRLRVREGRHGLRLAPGMVVIAPAGQQLRVSSDRVLALAPDRGEEPHAPSVDVIMRSAAAAFGARCLGVLLTGMGSDGAAGMAAIRAAGGLTIAESEASCVVYGMPRAAVERGAVVHELPLPEIVELLQRSRSQRGGHG
jgi:two-component system chemotaxis response regulator CheB